MLSKLFQKKSNDFKAKAINLAMEIDLGKRNLKEIIQDINKHTSKWMPIISFWTACSDDMTSRVLDRLHLETCLMEDKTI